MQHILCSLQGGSSRNKIVFVSGNGVVQRGAQGSGYGVGGSTVSTIRYLTERFGPISSFSGSYRADRWAVNIERSPGYYVHQ